MKWLQWRISRAHVDPLHVNKFHWDLLAPDQWLKKVWLYLNLDNEQKKKKIIRPSLSMVKLKFLQDIWQVFIHKEQMLWLSMTRSWLSVKRKKKMKGPKVVEWIELVPYSKKITSWLVLVSILYFKTRLWGKCTFGTIHSTTPAVAAEPWRIE